MKGDLSLQTIAVVILVLLVIVVLGYIFRTQIMQFAGSIFSIGNNVTDSINTTCLTPSACAGA